MDHLSLLAGGAEHTRAEWEKAAAAVLRKAGRMSAEDPDELVWQRLTHTTLDGVRVPPLGSPEDLRGLPDPGVPGRAPYTRGTGVSSTSEGWDVRAHLGEPDVKRAAAQLLEDLENGATSVWVATGRGGLAVSELGTVLEKVFLDLAPVILDAPSAPVPAARAFAELVTGRDLRPAAGTNLGGDPIGAGLHGYAETARRAEEIVADLAELAQRLEARALCVDGTALHDAGATDAQELGYTMAVGVRYLRVLTEAGLDVQAAASLVDFRYAVTDEQFTSIAKLRAARRLWHRVLELSGAPQAPGQVQHAVTSRPMMTKYDPYVNMLRGTVAAFAAGVGGADSITVLPFDTMIGLPEEFSRRNARNISSLLIHESHVARVTDPAGGAYAVERLTHDLAETGWAQLQRLEAEGGIEASLAAHGGLLDRVRQDGLRPRSQLVATRTLAVTGVSEFPDLHEKLPQRRPWPEGATVWEVNRYGIEFEAMRDEPAGTPVFLATMGPVAAHTARATFAGNLLAAGGVDAVTAGPTSSVAEVLEAYDGQPVVCLTGTDQAYAESGAELVEALREAGASHVIVAGPDEGLGVDDSCARGIDALAFLNRVREELAR